MLAWLNDTLTYAVIGLLMPAYDFLFDAGSRYFWFYCVTGLALAAGVYRMREGAQSFKAALLNPPVWTSESAINDYILLVATPALRLTVLSWALLNWQTVAGWVVAGLHWAGVSGTATDSNSIALAALLTVSLFVVDDFLRWWVHYMMHRIPELWEFHKVHHSAEHLNFATAERHHPLEVVITSAILAGGYGLVNGLFIGCFGETLTAYSVAGANIFLFIFNIAGGVLRHSPFWISFGPNVEHWIISPAMHQIHHSNRPEHFDRNMGGALAIWDRMFGTLHIPNGREVEGYGIGEETADFRSMGVILMRPFTKSAELIRERMRRTFGVLAAPALKSHEPIVRGSTSSPV